MTSAKRGKSAIWKEMNFIEVISGKSTSKLTRHSIWVEMRSRTGFGRSQFALTNTTFQQRAIMKVTLCGELGLSSYAEENAETSDAIMKPPLLSSLMQLE